MDKLASVERLLLSIPAKSFKEVNEILKYFKITGPTKLDNNKGKSYAQTSKSRHYQESLQNQGDFL